jgi:DNA-binding response OmpR family regulator
MEKAPSEKSKILLVEDDSNLSFVLRDNLERKNYEVSLCVDGMEGLAQFNREKFDLCLCDVMMPKMDGISMAEKMRVTDKQIPIIFISAKSMLDDKLAAFRIGGDDYLIKPFSMDELLFKVDVFLRRSKSEAVKEPAALPTGIGKYQFDFSNLQLIKNNDRYDLTLREAEVLRYLVTRQDQLVPREELLKQIWGRDDYFLGRSLDVFISRLRKYLKNDPRVIIENIHGVGFRLVVKS